MKTLGNTMEKSVRVLNCSVGFEWEKVLWKTSEELEYVKIDWNTIGLPGKCCKKDY